MAQGSQRLTNRFAIGNIYIVPNGGLQPANPTPFELKTIQDIMIDFKGKNVELRGQYLVPVDARIADVSFTGKMTVGTSNLNQLNNLLFAGLLNTTAASIDRINADEPHTIPVVTGPYTVQVTNHSTFTADLGVSYQNNSGQFTEVGSLTAAGQYTQSAGTYTFDVADASGLVYISYVDNGGGGNALTIPNNLQGQSPQFELDAWIPGNVDTTDSYTGYRFFNCRATSCKLLDAKNNDFAKWEIDFSIFCPVGSNVGELIQVTV